MNTSINILGAVTLLLYSCQNKSSLHEDGFDADTVVKTNNVEQQTLQKWFLFNRQSDSLITSAELIIDDQEKQLEKRGKDKNGERRLHTAKYHLEELKRKVRYIKEYETSTESFDSSVVRSLDSLKLDYLQEKIKLEGALCEFQEFTLP